MSNLLSDILIISILCSFFMIIMLVLRKVLAKHAGAWWRSIVWMIILIRLALPLMFSTPISVYKTNAYI